MSGEFQYVPGSSIVDLPGVNAALTDWFNQTYAQKLGSVSCDLSALTGLDAAEVSITIALPAVPQTETSDTSLRMWCQERITQAMPTDATMPYLVRVAPVIEVHTANGLTYQRLRMQLYVVSKPEVAA